MEAWILHIRAETIQESGSIYVGNRYSAWMSEKQALKAAAQYLLQSTENSWSGPFHNSETLRMAVRALIEVDKIQEAIDLVNEYSEASPYRSGSASSSKIQIIITKSTFLGSPFE